VRVWRLCRKKHSANPLDGSGARKHGGRWNHKGTPIVYCSSSLSLAALEYLVHGDSDLIPNDLIAISIALPSSISSKALRLESLPRNWRTYPAPIVLQDIGTEWARRKESLLLRVPSVVIPTEENFLLNPAHEEISKVTVNEIIPFKFDPRLTEKKG
jgi:RES domain-containing protein